MQAYPSTPHRQADRQHHSAAILWQILWWTPTAAPQMPALPSPPRQKLSTALRKLNKKPRRAEVDCSSTVILRRGSSESECQWETSNPKSRQSHSRLIPSRLRWMQGTPSTRGVAKNTPHAIKVA